MRLLLTLAFTLILSVPALADQPNPNFPRLADLDWLVGTWKGEHFGEVSYHTLLPRLGNVMHSIYAVVNEKGECYINEMTMIEETSTALYYHYAMFGRGMEQLHDTPFGFSGTYKITEASPGFMRYEPTAESPMRWGKVTLLEDGRVRSEICFAFDKLKPEEETIIELFAERVE